MEKENRTIRHFRDLDSWKESHVLTLLIYQYTKTFPQEEKFGLVSQVRRAVVSIESNIAEGFGRNTQNDKRQFYTMARGSLLEVETQIIIAKDLGYTNMKEFAIVSEQINVVGRLITGLLRSATTRQSY